MNHILNSAKSEYIKEILLIIAGCSLYAAGMTIVGKLTVIPGNLLGLAVVAHKLWGLPTGLVNICLSVPTIILGTIVIGEKMLLYTVIAIFASSAFIDSFSSTLAFLSIRQDWAAIFIGGIVIGIGCGMIYQAGATTGGTTVFGRLILLKFPNLKLGNLLIAMDGVIILLGSIVIHDPLGFIYSLIFEIIICKVIDMTMNCLQKFFGKTW